MKRILILLLTFTAAFTLFSCSAGSSGEDTVSSSSVGTDIPDTEVFDDTGNGLVLAKDGKTDYRIVRGDTSEEFERKGAADFLVRFEELSGVRPEIMTDWERNGKTDFEIIIGKTNREGVDFTLDRDKLGYGGYMITVRGERLVIAAHDAVGMAAALDGFFSLFEGKDLSDGIIMERTYEFMLEKANAEKSGDVLNYTDVKAMWLSQFDLSGVYCSGGQRSEAEFGKYIGKVLDNAASIGINTVIVQVRPNADSMYPSEYYCPSSYVVGSYGKEFSYDPFAIIVEMAHERNLSVHAWINPMRGMTSSEIEKTGEKYQLRKWWGDAELKNKYLPVVGGRVYLNVAYEEVRKLIIDGAREILENYDVDGLHMDDYFYPTTDAAFDKAAFSELGGGKSLADFRRGNLNALVSSLYSAVKTINPDVKFGISPAGNMDNDYNSLYADIYTWCGKPGYIDYICPQIYFGTEHATCPFSPLSMKWDGIIKADGVEMWIGMTVGKAVNGAKGTGDQYAGSGKNEWIEHKDVLKRCLEATPSFPHCTGVSYFCYQYFWDPLTGASNGYSAAERANFLPVLKTIKWSD